jgi:hypothetical protein
MPIPQFHEICLPLLRRVADGNDWTLAALRSRRARMAVFVTTSTFTREAIERWECMSDAVFR